MSNTQSTAVESNANNAVEASTYGKGLTNKEKKLLQDARYWEEYQEESEVHFIRHETATKGRAFDNAFEEYY